MDLEKECAMVWAVHHGDLHDQAIDTKTTRAPALLALLLGDLEQVAHERGAALGVRQLVGVDVADGADDGLAQLIRRQVHTLQEVDRAWKGKGGGRGLKKCSSAVILVDV